MPEKIADIGEDLLAEPRSNEIQSAFNSTGIAILGTERKERISDQTNYGKRFELSTADTQQR